MVARRHGYTKDIALSILYYAKAAIESGIEQESPNMSADLILAVNQYNAIAATGDSFQKTIASPTPISSEGVTALVKGAISGVEIPKDEVPEPEKVLAVEWARARASASRR